MNDFLAFVENGWEFHLYPLDGNFECLMTPRDITQRCLGRAATPDAAMRDAIAKARGQQ